MHVRLDQLGFFYWDPRIDPREPEYWDSRNGGPFLWLINYKQPDTIRRPLHKRVSFFIFL